MRTTTLALVSCLLAAGCTSRTSSNAPPVRSASHEATTPLPDTAFVEVRRDTVYGFRTVQGGCVFSSSDSGLHSGLPEGVIHETHTLSIDRMCRSVRAVGYRKALPARFTDTVGSESRSITVDLDSAAIAALKRRR